MPFLRVNKLNGLPVTDDGTQYRTLGALPPTRSYSLPSFGGSFEALPESEWQECSLRNWNVPILNQGHFGSCVGHGSVEALTYAWLIAGQQRVELSPTFIYAWINGGRDSGAQVSQGLECIKSHGSCLMNQFGEDKIYLQQMSAEAKATGLKFRVLEAYKVNSWVELGSALMRGMTVVCGIGVGSNFSRLDSNGVPPLPDTIVGGHCLCNVGLKKVSGIWVAETQNSWSSSWGQSGFCYLRKEHWDPRFGFSFDAFAVGSVIDNPDDTDDPPILHGKKQR